MSELIYSAVWLVFTVSCGLILIPQEQRTSGYLRGLAQCFGVGVAVECMFLAALWFIFLACAVVFWVCMMLLVVFLA